MKWLFFLSLLPLGKAKVQFVVQLPIMSQSPAEPVPAEPQRGPLGAILTPEGSSWAPQREWLPIYHQRTPYNEDEIVHLIHEIVRSNVLLSGLGDDAIVWPPEGGHAIDEALCDELKISESARSLIRRLPHPMTDVYFHGSSNPRLFYILEEFGLRWSREDWSSLQTADDKVGLVLPGDVQLVAGDRYASRVYIDTEKSE
jgi:hypothetical protein